MIKATLTEQKTIDTVVADVNQLGQAATTRGMGFT